MAKVARKDLPLEQARRGEGEIPRRRGLRVWECHLTHAERIRLSFASAEQGEGPMVSPVLIKGVPFLTAQRPKDFRPFPQTAVSLDVGLFSGTLDSFI